MNDITDLPLVIPPDLASIPAELRSRRQWVAWQCQPDPKHPDKPKKVPINPRTGGNASSTDPRTWSTCKAAHDYASRMCLNGIGYVFSSNDPYAGVDIDHCRDPETGEITPEAQVIINQLSSYTEVSPSGTGVHILVKGKVNGGGRKKDSIEMYSEGRYFTFSGRHIPDTPITIEPWQEALDALHRRVFGEGNADANDSEAKETLGCQHHGSDHEMRLGAGLQKDATFRGLWDGNITGYPSGSEADLALTQKLIRHVCPCPAVLKVYLRRSKLWDEKWQRDDYLDRTIHKALETARSVSPEDGGSDHGRAAPSGGSRLKEGVITGSSLKAQEFPEPRWAIPGLVPEGLTILAGPPKVGKSWLTLQMVAAVSGGKPVFGKIPVEQGAALLCCLEDGPRRCKARLMSLFGEEEWPKRLCLVFNIYRLDEGLPHDLDAWLAENQDTRLVVIDTLAAILPTQDHDRNVYRQDYRRLEALRKVALKHQTALLVVHHTNKREEALDPVNRLSGTSGLTAAADSLLILERPRGTYEGRLHVVGRSVDDDQLTLKQNEHGGWVLAERGLKPWQQIIWDALGDQAMTPKELTEILHVKDPKYTSDLVRKHLSRMRGDGLLRLEEGRYSRIPVTPVTQK